MKAIINSGPESTEAKSVRIFLDSKDLEMENHKFTVEICPGIIRTTLWENGKNVGMFAVAIKELVDRAQYDNDPI